MHNFSLILSGLQAVIAARAARDRALTVLLVAVWGRIARMGSRLERLIAQWRAGTLPVQRAPRVRAARVVAERRRFPTAPAWLVARVVETAPFGTQLAHLLTDAESQAFLAAVPQAGRIFRPLFRMLGVVPVPEAVRKRASPVYDNAVGVPALDGGYSGAMEARLFSRG